MKEYYHKKSCAGKFLIGMLVAVTVGGYFLFISKKAKRNRQKIDWWIEDMTEEILEKVKKIKNITEDKFDEVADGVMEKYSELKDMKDDKVRKIKKEARKRWEEAREEEEE